MSFQIAKTDHPNKAENTVLFRIMEAKYSKANLLLCLKHKLNGLIKVSGYFFLVTTSSCVGGMISLELGAAIFAIPLNPVSLPGLHITLDVYLKLFRGFEKLAKIADAMAAENNNDNDVDFEEYVSSLRKIAEIVINLEELKKRRKFLVEELNLFAVTQDDHFDEECHTNLLNNIDKEIYQWNNIIIEAREKTKDFDAGPSFTSVDVTLKN